ncbi:MAG: 16S rRNA (uracil(1498)-N(3))-methyltransferase [Clostridia bacterium]|nr:16S rRNA (uracil(1498)-N(3))-methyltransferase [Clostridia bacterium]
MPRFFVPKELLGEEAVLTGEDARHLSRSLRAREGEKIVLSDGEGEDRLYEIAGFTRDEVRLRLLEIRPSEGEPEIRVSLFLAAAKGDKTEFMIRKAVECGAAEICPFVSKNCVSRPEPGKKDDRWNRVALEAAMQSGRGIVPKVRELTDFPEAVRRAGAIGGGILYERATVPFGKALPGLLKNGKREIAFLIGSEGGFAPEEAEEAEKAGLVPLSLGKRILRCESVPLFVMGALLALTGEI